MRSATILATVSVLALLAGSAARGAASRATLPPLTLFATPKSTQFMNHADDRIRGMTYNPFNVDARAIVILANGKEKGNGPFPGDDVLFTFKLYSDPGLERSDGSAVFTCYYDFIKRATCDAYFELKDGTILLASGRVAFDSTKFTLAVEGGTDRFLGTGGEVVATPAAHDAQRFRFRFA